MSSNDNTTSGKPRQTTTEAYMDSAASTVRNVVDTVTGKAKEAGPSTQDNKPAPTSSSPPPPSGTYNQTVGSAKQSLGTLTGNENLRRQGEEQNEKGKEEEAARQARDWGEGVGQRVKGKAGEVLSSVKPEEPGKEEADRLKYKQMHDEGKAQQQQTREEINRRWGDAPK